MVILYMHFINKDMCDKLVRNTPFLKNLKRNLKMKIDVNIRKRFKIINYYYYYALYI